MGGVVHAHFSPIALSLVLSLLQDVQLWPGLVFHETAPETTPEAARRLLTGLRDAAEAWNGPGDVVVLCPPLARGPLRNLSSKVIPRVAIVSAAELLPTVRLQRVASVSLSGGVSLGTQKELKSESPQPNGDRTPVERAG